MHSPAIERQQNCSRRLIWQESNGPHSGGAGHGGGTSDQCQPSAKPQCECEIGFRSTYDIFNFVMDKSRDQTVLNRTNGLLVQQHVVVAAVVDVVVWMLIQCLFVVTTEVHINYLQFLATILSIIPCQYCNGLIDGGPLVGYFAATFPCCCRVWWAGLRNFGSDTVSYICIICFLNLKILLRLRLRH